MDKKKPHLPADFAELLTAFAGADVRYLIIGGYAVGYHDRPRTTKDLDLLLDPTTDNVRRTCAALHTFGAPASVIADLEVSNTDEIVWMGTPPLRVDLLKSAPGIHFDESWLRRVRDEWNGVPVSVISLDDLVQAKLAAAREQDIMDARNLQRAKGRK
jgi:hypothetical protein